MGKIKFIWFKLFLSAKKPRAYLYVRMYLNNTVLYVCY